VGGGGDGEWPVFGGSAAGGGVVGAAKRRFSENFRPEPKNSGIVRFRRRSWPLWRGASWGVGTSFPCRWASATTVCKKVTGSQSYLPKKSKFSNFFRGTPNFRDFGPKLVRGVECRRELSSESWFVMLPPISKKLGGPKKFFLENDPPRPRPKKKNILTTDSGSPALGGP
jgi:hypothetical protein